MADKTKNCENPYASRLDFAKKINSRIKKWCKKTGKTEADFCRENGFAHGVFSRWKHVHKVPQPPFIKRLDHALKKEGV